MVPALVVPISSDRHWVRVQGILLVAGTCLTAASLIVRYQHRHRMQLPVLPLRPRPCYIESHSVASRCHKSHTPTLQSVAIRNCLHQLQHRYRIVGLENPVSASAGVGVRVPSFLMWKADFWILATRDGRALAHAADFCHEVGLHFVSRVAVVSVGYLTPLLRSYCASSSFGPSFLSYYPFPGTTGISATFFTCFLSASCQITLRRFHD